MQVKCLVQHLSHSKCQLIFTGTSLSSLLDYGLQEDKDLG